MATYAFDPNFYSSFKDAKYLRGILEQSCNIVNSDRAKYLIL